MSIDPIQLIRALSREASESARHEFKVNNSDPEMIGKAICALANGARLHEHQNAYLIWGVQDGTGQIVGTTFRPSDEKVGNQPLEAWLGQMLQPSLALRFDVSDTPHGRVVVLRIHAALRNPQRFKKQAWVRVGPSTRHLADFPVLEATLWQRLNTAVWEELHASSGLTDAEVLGELDVPTLFAALGRGVPSSLVEQLQALESREMITRSDDGRWDVTNLGALSAGRSLKTFGRAIERKGVRFLHYSGKDVSSDVVDEVVGGHGYLFAFPAVVGYVMNQIPKPERIGITRTKRPVLPEIAVRELIGNALVHQDLAVTGAGPMITLFSDRLEVSSPGRLLVEPDRIMDHRPRSRNESLARLLDEVGYCEQRGRGADNVVIASEAAHLPPVEWRNESDSAVAILHGPRAFRDMTVAERIRGCYQHSVMQTLQSQRMRNRSLRARFNLDESGASLVSAVFRQTVDAGKIVLADPDAPKSGYIPYWAA